MILQFLSIIISLEIVNCGPIALIVDAALIWLKLRNVQRWVVNAYAMVIVCIKCPDFRAPLLICLCGKYRILLGSVGTMGVTLLVPNGINDHLLNLLICPNVLGLDSFCKMFAWRHQSTDWTSTLGRD